MENEFLCNKVIITIVTLIITLISFVIKSAKSSKNQKTTKMELQINDFLLKLMEEAEKFINYSGEEKKAYVLTRVKEEFLTQKIQVDDNKVNDKIERLIQLSKNVNRTSTNKTLKKLSEVESNDQ